MLDVTCLNKRISIATSKSFSFHPTQHQNCTTELGYYPEFRFTVELKLCLCFVISKIDEYDTASEVIKSVNILQVVTVECMGGSETGGYFQVFQKGRSPG